MGWSFVANDTVYAVVRHGLEFYNTWATLESYDLNKNKNLIKKPCSRT